MTSLKNWGFRKSIGHLTGSSQSQLWQWAETQHVFSGRSYLAKRPLRSVHGFPLPLLLRYLSIIYLSVPHWFQRPAILRNRKGVVGAQESSSDHQHIRAETGSLGELSPCSQQSPNVFLLRQEGHIFHENRTESLCRLRITEGRMI